MTFKDAFERATAIARARNDAISLEVEAWFYTETDSTEVTWKLWSRNEASCYRGQSGQQVIDDYEGSSDMAAQLASVGEP